LVFGSGPARLTRISAEAWQRHRRVRSTQSTHSGRRLWLRGGGAIGQAPSAAYQLMPPHPPESGRGAPEALAAAGSGARVVEAGPPPPAQRETRLPTAVSQDTTRWRTTRQPRRRDLRATRRARRAQRDRTGRRGSACCGGSDCTPHCRGGECSAVPVRTASSTLYRGARASARGGMYRRRTAAASQGRRSRPRAR
jgi:hypothetical protein